MIALGPGATFGKYRILRVVGRGGMGLVYLAEDQDLCRQIALKVLHRGFAADEDFIHRFRQEARTIAGLKHPNIVPVHALDLIGDDLAIAMDFIEGGTLAGSKLSLQEALRYLGDILEALAWCHDKGIVHRDVKPNNILISPLGNALLSDFGLAKLLADFHASSVVTWASSGLFVGTPMYAPPEAWEGAEPTAAWDLYSVGTVLFEAIAGRLPYDAQTPLALIKQMIERPAPRLAELAPDISPELGELVDGLLRPDPLARPQHAREALERLSRAPEAASSSRAGRRTVAMRQPFPRGRQVLRKSRVRLFLKSAAGRNIGFAAAAGGLLALAALLLVAWFRPQTGPAPATNTLSREMVFDTLSPTAQEVWPHHLFMAARPQPGQWVALASQGTQLWRLEIASLEAGGLGISGAWAEYTDTLARFFRSGELAGTGRWLQVGQELAVTLDFHAIQDGSEWSTPLLLRRSAEPLLLPEFARRLERSGYVQPLLYNELLPRGAGWVEAVESEFLNAASPRVQVPFLRGSSNVLLVDGKLDENTWRTPALGGIEGHGATAGVSPGTLMVRYDEGNLYVGLHLTQTPERPRLLFTLLTQFDIPASSSARWMVQFEKDTISARRWVRHGQETPWDCQWRIAAGSLPGEAPGAAWEAEALIPIANLGNVVPPRPGQRWRLNCAAGGPSGGSVAGAAYWGSEDIEAIEEGILLVFEGA